MRAAGDPDLKIYGIFGYPLGHTASPAIQNRAFDYHRLKSFYFAFERSPARFRFLMRNLKSLLLDGFNVTVPYKRAVIPYLRRLSPEAKAVGAVNTVKKEQGVWTGYNTDIHGFLAGLKEAKFNPKGKSALILGAGGSARAISFALAKSGIRRLFIANRTRSHAQRLVKNLQRAVNKCVILRPKAEESLSEILRFTQDDKVLLYTVDLKERNLKQILSQVDLLVNATKIGLERSDRSLVPSKAFPKRKILIYDLIYKPARTKLLRTACALGHKVMNGETMLVYQGAKAFEIWTGEKAPIWEMKKALRDVIYHK